MNAQIKTELLGMNMQGLEEYMASMGEPRFRSRQIHKWIYQKEVNSFYDMSDLPRELRQKLDEKAQISIPRVLKQRVSVDGTRKFLMELEDKKRIETVLIPQSKDKNTRYTLCVSTQVGCPIGCAFCATGVSGFQRNLKYYEIVGEYLGAKRELEKKVKAEDNALIANVVYMGMGEPMLNYEDVIKSIRILNDSSGINLGQRHITISTSGDIGGINKLTREDLQVTLAISLHACNDETRNDLIPLNRKYPISELMEAINNYILETNRRVTFEYIMLDNINVSRADADDMIKLIKPVLANVNLIPYNEVEGLIYKKPSDKTIMQFYNWLVNGGLNVTIREEKGSDIEAACGQLRAKRER